MSMRGKTITFHTLNLSSQKIIEKANHLVRAIEYTSSDDAVRLPSVPSFTEGFRRDPMAHEGVFERIASFDLILSPRGTERKKEDMSKAMEADV
eukprot:g24810.t1